ncbi:MAG: tRNA (uridine(34)/cytosine(34)/5-carboxymethylaminomethyluridine(34)-2'-O)-methyltransferase TrmL [Clostridiales bacterium]|nr:tRNA (uridine(34)/cytosine(34)/5-carboxymethylaminomethyluridine(34)-2'-O)-methyltransferase TrmL [Clostridiales bacterium]
MKLNIVLVEPEIPQNTGNIARTCAAIGAKLHLVKPLGFEINDKTLKRAGLDYWDKLDVIYYENFQEFLEAHKQDKLYFVTTKAKQDYTQIDYAIDEEIFVLFGKETKGLPEDVLKENMETSIRIPMRENIRSLNLSNSVAIVVYEILRQDDFKLLEKESKYFD